ncbi:ninjurin 1, partial [Chelydra serpentina]
TCSPARADRQTARPPGLARAALPGRRGIPGGKGSSHCGASSKAGLPGTAAACVCAARREGRYRARLGRRISGPCGQASGGRSASSPRAAQQPAGHSTMASASESIELNGQPGGGGGQRAPSDRSRLQRLVQGQGPINMNHYANKKSAAESMLDIALLMANASQLKAVMEQGPSFSFYIPLIVLISISLILQIAVGVLLIFLVKYDLNNPSKHAKLDFLNNIATGLVFIIVVVNIFITAFGVQKPVAEAASRQ